MKKAKRSRKRKLPSLDAGDDVRSLVPSTLGGQIATQPIRRARRGMGAGSGAQSGDLQNLSRVENADSESVEELAAEGQYREAEIVGAIERALAAGRPAVIDVVTSGRVTFKDVTSPLAGR